MKPYNKSIQKIPLYIAAAAVKVLDFIARVKVKMQV